MAASCRSIASDCGAAAELDTASTAPRRRARYNFRDYFPYHITLQLQMAKTRGRRDLMAHAGRGAALLDRVRLPFVFGAGIGGPTGGKLVANHSFLAVFQALPLNSETRKRRCQSRPQAVGTVPPSMMYSVPVMEAARGEARNAMRSATSSGLAGRPSGIPPSPFMIICFPPS